MLKPSYNSTIISKFVLKNYFRFDLKQENYVNRILRFGCIYLYKYIYITYIESISGNWKVKKVLRKSLTFIKY